jgi:hypothetical protein
LSTVERSYVAKYPGDSGTAIKAIAEELLSRLADANAAGAMSAPPPSMSSAEPSVTG